MKDSGPTEFGLAQVLDIVLQRWFLVDEVQHIEVDSKEALEGDMQNEGKVNASQVGDYEAITSSPQV